MLHSLHSVTNVLLCLNLVAKETAGEKQEESRNVYPNNQSRTDKSEPVRWSLHFIYSYAPLVTQRYWRRNFFAMNSCCCYCKLTPLLQRTGTQRRTKVAPWSLLCSCCSRQKGTSWDKATSSSKEIKPTILSNCRLVVGWYLWDETPKPPWFLIYNYCHTVWLC